MEASSQEHQQQKKVDEHAPRAERQQEVILGDAGLGEQQPAEPNSANQDTPLCGAQAPHAQSGVPLREDREAGVQAGPVKTVVPAPEVAATPGPTPAA